MILQFPTRPIREATWICGCGGQQWLLLADGDCVCADCKFVSTIIAVVRTAPASWNAQSDTRHATKIQYDWVDEAIETPWMTCRKCGYFHREKTIKNLVRTGMPLSCNCKTEQSLSDWIVAPDINQPWNINRKRYKK